MESLFIIDNCGNAWKTEDFSQKHQSGVFIVKQTVERSYSYGNHATYVVISENGIPSRKRFGDYYLKSYSTCGVAEKFCLKVVYDCDSTELTHSLYVDARFLDLADPHPLYAKEWDISNPHHAVLDFMQDISIMGHEARVRIDELKRECYTAQRSKSILEEKRQMLELNCEGATEIVIPEGVELINGDQFDECKIVKRIIIPASVEKIILSAFNHCPHLKDVLLIGDSMKQLLPPFPSGGWRGSNVMNTKAGFYVKDELVEEYKTNTYWNSLLSGRVFAIVDLFSRNA